MDTILYYILISICSLVLWRFVSVFYWGFYIFFSCRIKGCCTTLQHNARAATALKSNKTYLPSQMTRVVELWKTSLSKVNEKAGQSLASPDQYENLFPGFRDSLKAEQYLTKERKAPIPAVQAGNPNFPQNQLRNPIEEALAAEAAGDFHYIPTLHLEEQEESFHEAEGSPILPVSTQPSVPLISPPTHPIPADEIDNEDDEEDDDDLELDIDNLQLDDNLDTGDITLDEDLLSED